MRRMEEKLCTSDLDLDNIRIKTQIDFLFAGKIN
jgi:hypothetical protein